MRLKLPQPIALWEETMANDRNDKDSQSNRDSSTKRDRTIGEGMNSLDSTQAPLKAETGEPDWDAMEGGRSRNSQDSDNSDRQSNR
jgi:hypothetical protein